MSTAIRKQSFEHHGPVSEGEGEFWILGKCIGCGWRVAVPGEGMPFPECPKCNEPTYPVLPQRAPGVGQGFGDSLGALAYVLPEGEALEAANRGAKIKVIG